MIDFSQSIVATSFFSANLLFGLEDNYFTTLSEQKPLLHIWSLSVEKKFYLLFPIFFGLIWSLNSKQFFYSSIIIIFSSFLFCIWFGSINPSFSFYFSITRVWEFFVGSIAALVLTKHQIKSNNLFSIIGILLILISFFFIDGTKIFPGLYTIFPVFGVFLIIIFGEQKTIIAKFLSIKIFVWLGLISYGVYLWHQPLFAFSKIILSGELSIEIILGITLLSIILGYLSRKFVEIPSKNYFSNNSSKFFITICITFFLFFNIFGFIGIYTEGIKSRFDIEDKIFSSIKKTPHQSECASKKMQHKIKDWLCNFGEISKKPKIFLFGDSHAVNIFPAINKVSSDLKYGGLFAASPGCTPFLGIHSLRNDQHINNCYLINKRVFNYIKNNKIEYLILAARWSYYTDGGYSGRNFSYISLNKVSERSKSLSRKAFEYGLEKTLKAYEDLGVKVIIIKQIPEQKYDPIDLYSKSKIYKNKNLENLSVKLNEHLTLQNFVNKLFLNANATIFSFDNSFCQNYSCPVGNNDVSYYSDTNHLTYDGSKLFYETLKNYIKNF